MRLVGVAKTVATLALLGVALPANAAFTAVATAVAPPPPAPRPPGERRTVLLSGGKMTKALALARAFHGAGHRVVLAESARYRWSGHRFSRAVDAFRVIPSSGDPGYAEALRDLVVAEGVDVYVPVCSPASSRHDAFAAELLAPHCEVLHVAAEVVDVLDDKYRFATAAAELGLGVPDSHLITDPAQVLDAELLPGRRYILKSIPYDPVRRLDLTPLPRPTRAETAAFVADLPISPEHPWILQELVEGTEYCAHATVRGGDVRVWACCESSAFQLNYAMVDKPEIEAWVRRFVAALELTGQVSFDFIEASDGRLCAIECNPRAHSAITMFHEHPGMAAAYLEDGPETITPLPGSRPTYWLYQELWRVLRDPRRLPERAVVVARGRDALFDRRDPVPFFTVPHVQITSLLLGNLRAGRDWIRIDFNIGKLVEAGGD